MRPPVDRSVAFLRPRPRAIAVALAAVVVAAASAVAQSPTPVGSPAPSTSPAAAPGTDPDLAARFPATLDGSRLTVTTVRGEALLALGDPNDTAFAGARDQAVAMLAAFGVPIEGLSAGWATDAATGQTVGIGAVRIAGLDPALLPAVVSALVPALHPGSVLETVQVADREVLRVTGSDPADVTHLLLRDDTVWIVRVDPEMLEAVLGLLR
jgi:hypothetical protein